MSLFIGTGVKFRMLFIFVFCCHSNDRRAYLSVRLSINIFYKFCLQLINFIVLRFADSSHLELY